MRFYTFHQNNSGGRFVYDAARGISEYVIIQAPSARVANALAVGIGLYFDGQGDCPCCGDRWDEQWSDDAGTVRAEINQCAIFEYGLGDMAQYTHRWMGDREFVFVHLITGEVMGFHYPAETKAIEQ